MPFARMIGELLSFEGERADEWQRTRITGCELELPIELTIGCGADGKVEIGSTPPLYRVDTSLRPSYHQVRVVAEVTEAPDGD